MARRLGAERPLGRFARYSVLAGFIVTPSAHAAQAQEALTVVIRLYDMTGVQPDLMDRVQARVAVIFREAGIRVEWRDCRPEPPFVAGCDGVTRASDVFVRLVSGAPALSPYGCGAALLPGTAPARYVTLFVDCLRGAADALGVRVDAVFAAALAHEIGHLLLGSAHGRLGLMQARPGRMDWQRAAHGGLLFTPDESRALRHALAERQRSQIARQ